MAATNGSDNGQHLTPDVLDELRRLARSRPTSGRGRVAKLGALRTLERLEREAERRKPEPLPPLPLLELSMGPTEGWGPRAEELEGMWPAVRERVMESHRDHDRNAAGRRPWIWWRWVAGEEMPLGRFETEEPSGSLAELRSPPPKPGESFNHGCDEEALRLAELGELEDWELAVLRERAAEARARVGTDAEQKGPGCWPDREAVRLWDEIETVRGVPDG